MSYRINEVFYSVQGEGLRAGTANVFIRFAGCNLKCSKDDALSGFDCDTEFASGIDVALPEDVLARAQMAASPFIPIGQPSAVIFTGGEPALQLDGPLIARFKSSGWHVAIETNGTRELAGIVDWITCSPKSAEHTLKLPFANELKYVRHAGQGIPKPAIHADHHLLSPAFEADGSLSRANLEHCIRLVKENPAWRLSVQQHKTWRVR